MKLRRLVRRLEGQGVIVRKGGSHIVCVHHGKVVAVLPYNLQEKGGASYKKTLGQLRKYGLVV